MIDTKKIGRPKKFDREEALAAALNVFWAKGYDGASMKDLTSAMNVNGPSLYAEFGNKQNLYHLAIDSYVSNDACEPLIAFESEPNIEKAVGAFMSAAIDYAANHPSGVKGCFLASCVVTNAGQIEGIDERLLQALRETDTRLAERFEAEKSKGALPADFPSLQRAQLMFDLRQGYVFRARSGCSSDELKAEIDYRVRVILM